MFEEIAEAREEKILLGQFEPSTMLPSKIELMKQFGVSRNILREALRMLEASGRNHRSPSNHFRDNKEKRS